MQKLKELGREERAAEREAQGEVQRLKSEIKRVVRWHL
tara:strand:- start:98 stop:211 length:114 start_codon:yes stop_codon:yes gene_type:complete